MKKNILIGTLLCGMVLGSVVAPNIALAAENLREEATKKKKLTLHFTADFGEPKSVQISTTTGQFLDLKNFLPKGYDLAADQNEKIKITEQTDAVTINLAAQTRYDMIQFMGGKGVSMRSILKHTGEMITIKDYEKFVPKGYVVDTDRQTTFVSGNDRWGQTFHVYIKPAPVITHVEKEIKFVTEDGVDLEGFSALFNVNGQLVIDPDKVPEGYEIEPRYITVLDNGEKTIEIKLFKTYKNKVQFLTPDGEIVSTAEIKGRANHEVIVQAPEGYEYPDASFKLFTILSENTTQKIIVTSLNDSSADIDVPDPDNEKPGPDSGAEDNDSSLEEKPEENDTPKPDVSSENPEEIPGNNSSGNTNGSAPEQPNIDQGASEKPGVDQGNVPDKSEEKPNVDHTTKPVEKPTKPGTKPTIKPDKQPGNSEKPEKPGKKPINKPEEKPNKQPLEQPGSDSSQKPVVTVPNENPSVDVDDAGVSFDPIKGQVMTHGQKTVQLFDKTGKKLSYALNSNTDWRIDQKMTLNGETYYRVATNSWVKASDVLEYDRAEQVVNTGDKMRSLYDSKGKSSSHRSLAQNSEWFVDKAATINGKTYYRVSTNEWVLADDMK